MSGLATVTAALKCERSSLARIAAVHLRIPDLPDQVTRDAIEAEDVLIKYLRQRELTARIAKQAPTIRNIPVGRPGRKADVADNFVRRMGRKQ